MEKTELRKIGQRVAAERHKQNMTQGELAVASGLALKTVSMLENGQRELKVETLARLCQSLKVSADYLLFGTVADSDAMYYKERISKLAPGISQSLKDLLEALYQNNR